MVRIVKSSKTGVLHVRRAWLSGRARWRPSGGRFAIALSPFTRHPRHEAARGGEYIPSPTANRESRSVGTL